MMSKPAMFGSSTTCEGAMARRGLCVLLALVCALRAAFVAGGLGWRRERSLAALAGARDITPLGNQVLVEELEEPEDQSGLVLAEGSKKKTRLRLGRIEALGQGNPGDQREPKLIEALKVGDTVLWEDFANRKLEDDPDNKLFLVPIRSVKAKVNP
ncbi:unnamed protein product [Durusdinium trenchii]|uniref:Uncharacterized protein n=2 Tax=Durusdinium trenchii TaxID=1381693 RepID=A0ABP0SZ58_9DINO